MRRKYRVKSDRRKKIDRDSCLNYRKVGLWIAAVLPHLIEYKTYSARPTFSLLFDFNVEKIKDNIHFSLFKINRAKHNIETNDHFYTQSIFRFAYDEFWIDIEN